MVRTARMTEAELLRVLGVVLAEIGNLNE